MKTQSQIIWLNSNTLGHCFSWSFCLQAKLPVKTLCFLEARPGGNGYWCFLSWLGEQYFYAFPPFSLINRVLQKIEQDQSQGIIIVPMWNSQVWFPRLLHLLIDFPVTLPKGPRTLLLPFNQEKADPLHKKLTLLACKLFPHSKRHFAKSCHSHIAILERESTHNSPSTSGNGCCFAVQGVLIHTKQLQHKL